MKSNNSLTLIITDDRYIANQLAKILKINNRKWTKQHQAHVNYFQGKWHGNNYMIITTNGHLQVFQNSSLYKWTGVDPINIIKEPGAVIPVLNAFNKNIYFKINNLISNENIKDLIIAVPPSIISLTIGLKEIGNLLKKINSNLEPKKLILSILLPDHVKLALLNPSEFTLKEKQRAEIEYLRSYLDAIISFSITQELTYTIKKCLNEKSEYFRLFREELNKTFRDKKNIIIPMSRAQALILKSVHENMTRVEQASKNSKVQQYEVMVRLKSNKDVVELPVENGIFTDEVAAKKFVSENNDARYARVDNISASETMIPIPPLYNLISLLDDASNEFGFPTTYTFKILLDLYYNRMISYPDVNSIEVNEIQIDHEEILQRTSEIYEFEELSNEIIEKFSTIDQSLNDFIRPKDDSIIPILIEREDSYFFKNKKNHWKIFNLVIKRYLLQFLDPAKKMEKKIRLDLNTGNKITINLSHISREGFLKYYPGSNQNYQDIMDINVLTSVEVNGFKIVKKVDLPGYFTDSSFLKYIKEKISEDTASFVMMIEKLVANNYIRVLNKNLKLTTLGSLINEFMNGSFDFLGSLEFSQYFKDKLNSLENSSPETFDDDIKRVKNNIINHYLNKFEEARKKTADFLLEKGIDVVSDTYHTIYDAGKGRFEEKSELHIFCHCGGVMRIVEPRNNRRFLACENRLECGNTLALPFEGKISKCDKTCKICGKKIIKIDSEIRGEYFFCPTCWTESFRNEGTNNIGYCSTCSEMESCWGEDDSVKEELKEKLYKLNEIHLNAFEKCPRCQESNMILVVDEDEQNAKLVCENPFCNYFESIPQKLIGKITPSSKKCFICPMNAILYEPVEGISYYVCIHCLNEHFKNHDKQIGFCNGCVFQDICFDIGKEVKNDGLSIKEIVKRKLEESTLNPG
ncbi:MAG: DNA topoisomerase [Promethearchaeota archaeon]